VTGVETVDSVATQVRYCGELTESGAPCRQIVGLNGSGKCIHHDPLRAEEATEMRRRGAQTANAAREPQSSDCPPPPAPQDLDGVCALLSWIPGAVLRGQIDRGQASAATYALQNLRTALSLRDLEAKYKALAQRIEAMQKAQGR
jgi:hypothetical protein